MDVAVDIAPAENDKEFCKLDIFQIETYDRNPRILPNPKAKDIEASLRASGGYDGVLVVTQRPGSDVYMVQAGGNTTLSLLKKLYSDTNDENFRVVTVDVRPWTGEFDVMAYHYRENNQRGDLCFGERSLEMYALYRQYCDDIGECGAQPTVANFCGYLAETYGISCAPPNFSLYKYTAEILADAMPFLVKRTRFTRTQAIAIRTLYKKIGTVWSERGVGTKKEFDEVFFEHLSRRDKSLEAIFAREVNDNPATIGIGLDEDELISALKNEFARSESIDCTYSQAGVWINAALRTGPEIVRQVEAESLMPDANPAPSSSAKASLTASPNKLDRSANDVNVETPSNEPTRMELNAPHEIADPLRPPSDVDDLPTLRAKAFGYAIRIATRNRLQELIVATPDIGFGYLVTDVHEDVLQPPSDGLSSVTAAWWALAAGCALTMTPSALREEYMPDESFLRTIIEQRNIDLMAQSFPIQSIDQSGRLWDALKVKDWSDYLAIQKIHKAIMLAANGLQGLWNTRAPSPERSRE